MPLLDPNRHQQEGAAVPFGIERLGGNDPREPALAGIAHPFAGEKLGGGMLLEESLAMQRVGQRSLAAISADRIIGRAEEEVLRRTQGP
eukprot:6466485-Alexandrium_andersonii.AAC.1